MKLTIEHETRYGFAGEANYSIQYLRVTPREDPCQRILSWNVSSASQLTRWSDGFDNVAHVCVQESRHKEVTVLVKGEVETFDTLGILPANDGLPPLIFLSDTLFTKMTDAIRQFAAPYQEVQNDAGTLAAMHALMAGIGEAVTYQAGFTNVETDANHALAAGKGVCQDHAHLFIAGARTLRVPARYVSGYLLAGTGDLASHAWAECFIDGLGWVSFDPSNQQSATDAYVRLAIAHDFGDASPVRGVREGGGIESMNVRVQVQRSYA
ncbi:MAG: transglutaminase family protein [Rhodospirillales bacterium]|nr:transglutaminase family protein [Rhodospirillales bacterium]